MVKYKPERNLHSHWSFCVQNLFLELTISINNLIQICTTLQENLFYYFYGQGRLWSACANARADQSFPWPWGIDESQGFSEETLMILIILRRSPDWPVSKSKYPKNRFSSSITVPMTYMYHFFWQSHYLAESSHVSVNMNELTWMNPASQFSDTPFVCSSQSKEFVSFLVWKLREKYPCLSLEQSKFFLLSAASESKRSHTGASFHIHQNKIQVLKLSILFIFTLLMDSILQTQFEHTTLASTSPWYLFFCLYPSSLAYRVKCSVTWSNQC